VRVLPPVVLVLGVFLLSACQMLSGSLPESPEPGEANATQPPSDEVALTVYLRDGNGNDARLQAVSRQVPIEGNLAQRAVELMLAGAVDGEQLQSPWPSGTQVVGVTVDGGVATVDLTDDALRDAPAPERAAHLEVLALAALANTLTELPTIESVQVTVDGEGPETNDDLTEFWGGWGIPGKLTRDVSLVGEQGSGDIPARTDFSLDSQTVGASDADPVVIRNVMVRDRITYIRMTIELADAAQPDMAPSEFPRTHARSRPGELTVEVTKVDGVADDAGPGELGVGLRDHLRSVELGDGQRTRSVRLTLRTLDDDRRQIHLHTVSSPSRIVLDIMK
jgi:hypothetical protein